MRVIHLAVLFCTIHAFVTGLSSDWWDVLEDLYDQQFAAWRGEWCSACLNVCQEKEKIGMSDMHRGAWEFLEDFFPKRKKEECPTACNEGIKRGSKAVLDKFLDEFSTAKQPLTADLPQMDLLMPLHHVYGISKQKKCIYEGIGSLSQVNGPSRSRIQPLPQVDGNFGRRRRGKKKKGRGFNKGFQSSTLQADPGKADPQAQLRYTSTDGSSAGGTERDGVVNRIKEGAQNTATTIMKSLSVAMNGRPGGPGVAPMARPVVPGLNFVPA